MAHPIIVDLTPAMLLLASGYTGMQVVRTSGRLVDYLQRPPAEARPPAARSSEERMPFKESEVKLLQMWMAAAEEAGISTNAAFEPLEGLLPTHSFLSWKTKWQEGCIQKLPRLIPRNDAAFPNLRLDRVKNVLRELGLASEDAFKQWLAQPFVAAAYTDLLVSALAPERAEVEFVMARGERPSFEETASDLNSRVSKAVSALAGGSSKFLAPDPDKSGWTKDEHSIRFIVQVVEGARADGGCWSDLNHDSHAPELCQRALRVLHWLQWAHRPTGDQTSSRARIEAEKQAWRSFLAGLQAEPQHRAVDSASSPSASPLGHPGRPLHGAGNNTANVSDGQAQRILQGDRREALAPALPLSSRSQDKQPARLKRQSSFSVIANSNKRNRAETIESSVDSSTQDVEEMTVSTVLSIATYSAIGSKKLNQQKGAGWVAWPAYSAWTNAVAHRLSGWGVAPQHKESCVLVTDQWKRRYPPDIVGDAPQNLADKVREEAPRLRFAYGDMTLPWGRAAAWFSTWPRRGVDWDVLVAGSDGATEMHGSHLCHQELCIVPVHICYEDSLKNHERNTCKSLAQHFRRYNVEIPEYCLYHDPPCLMQLAALTAVEAMHIQIFVLRRAMDPACPLPPDLAPLDGFSTFENCLPHKFRAGARPGLATYTETLVTPPDPSLFRRQREKVYVCPFCRASQGSWTVISHYWSHLRDRHQDDVSIPDRLEAVKEAGTMYLDYQAARGYDCRHNNKRIHQMVKQTQLSTFDWKTVLAWTLQARRPKEPLTRAARVSTAGPDNREELGDEEETEPSTTGAGSEAEIED